MSEFFIFIEAQQNFQHYPPYNIDHFQQYPQPQYTQNQYNNQYDPSVDDQNYRTFWHKNRRYGQPNNHYGWKPGDPRFGKDESYVYDRVSVCIQQ